jgi:branched-chain amino acid aminotransferase
MRHWAWLNGTLLPAEEARVSVFDSGFMQGIGLFETMRAYNGQVFRLEAHLQRLARSAAALGWTVPPDIDDLADGVRQVLLATGMPDARVRLTVTTGSLHAQAGDTPGLTCVATGSAGEKYPDEYYTRGVTVVLSGACQSRGDPTAGHKTTSYFARLASLRAAHEQGAFEALWLNPEDKLAEAALSSVFAVLDGKLYVPPLETPVLPGITRAALLELAAALGIAAVEQPVDIEDVRAADELLLASSMTEVVPIVRIGREPVGNEKPGDVTRALAVAYTRLVDEESS